MFGSLDKGYPGKSRFASIGGHAGPFHNTQVQLPPPPDLGWMQQIQMQGYGDNPFWRDLMRQFGGTELMGGRGLY